MTAYCALHKPKVKDLNVCFQPFYCTRALFQRNAFGVCLFQTTGIMGYGHISVLAHKVLLRVIVCAPELPSIQSHSSRKGLFCTPFISMVSIWSNLSSGSGFHKM